MRHNKIHSLLGTMLASLLLPSLQAAPPAPGSGDLRVIDKNGQPGQACPLKRTDVKAEITGFLSRVTVTQNFENPFSDRIEAVYTFPLPQNAAVDDMTMLVGDRVIKGKIKPREEAKAIYDAARQSGRTASLLEQERPNIFTQSVANIRPGEKVRITLSYVETLPYESGTYSFVFPMVVGPRYMPGQPAGQQGGGWSPDTTRVPDASRISPQVTPAGTRAGHDITVEVSLDAGVPIDALTASSHEVITTRPDSHRAIVKLKDLAVIPNKDFILKYDVAGRKVEDAVLTHRGEKGGFFTMILQPPDRVTPAEITPKELVFVVDTSGSMHGFPLDKSKEVMRLALTHMNPRDTFNLITFSGDTRILFPAPVPATAENVERARQFLESHRGGGGTEMMKAIRAALEPTTSQEHVRVVAFFTDGYVGNDMEIVGAIQRYSNARVFSFGIGNSVNRFLLDKMAEHGRGEVEYVTLKDDGSAAAKRFFERMRHPLLTDIAVEWNGLPVSEVYPHKVPDLFSAKPLILHGRYGNAAKGIITLTGKAAGKPFRRTIAVDLPASEPKHDVLATLWARTKVSELMARDYAGIQRGNPTDDLRNQITKLGLDFRLMTQFTAFVAVEERTVTDGGAPRRIEVPVEMPEGVSREGVFGEADAAQPQMALRKMAPMRAGAPTGYFGGTAGIRQRDEARPSVPMTESVEVKSAAPQLVVPARAKLHPDLAALLAKRSTPAPFVTNGKAEIRVYLVSNNAAGIEALKKLGLEVIRHEAANQLLIARIAVDKLEALAKMSEVRYISPK
ncbi:MAG: VWA domain-containing protein [Bryobacterales bacterium]|nr:VWA domain-containing protein [Bryobacterales bacterium]